MLDEYFYPAPARTLVRPGKNLTNAVRAAECELSQRLGNPSLLVGPESNSKPLRDDLGQVILIGALFNPHGLHSRAAFRYVTEQPEMYSQSDWGLK